MNNTVNKTNTVTSNPNQTETKNAGPRVLISAAHTSVSPGEISNGLREYDLTKKMLEFTVKHLEKENIEFKPVPVDLQLLKRIDWINNTGYSQEKGDIMIELHVNDGGKSGIETWYSDAKADDNESQRLAEIITNELTKQSKKEKQGVRSEFEHELGSLLILNQTKTISIATEILYIDNEEDRKILKDDNKLEEICRQLVEAIKIYRKEVEKKPAKKKKMTSTSFGAGTSLANSFSSSPARSFGGGFGGDDGLGSFGGFGNNSFGNANFFGKDPLDNEVDSVTTGQSKSGLTMDRAERKKMIEEAYQKYLGKEPKKTDVEYFLNMGISEDELLMKIVKSKDHEEAIEHSKEYSEMKSKQKEQERELLDLQGKVQELTAMYNNFQMLLAHKNEQIKQMQHELVRGNIVKQGEYYDPNRISLNRNQETTPPSSSNNAEKKGILSKLLGS